jgi:hypothetical protein
MIGKMSDPTPPATELAQSEIRSITFLSLTEVGLGSVLHSFKVPASGHFLSLNQGLLLTQFTKSHSYQGRNIIAQSCARISLCSGLLKSLSPAGKKLTPMLAISVQGLLYSFGLMIGGCGLLGRALGSVFLSFWAFAQPLLLAWLFVGTYFFEALEKLWQKTLGSLGFSPEAGLGVFLGLIAFKALLALGLVIFSGRFGKNWQDQLSAEGRKLLLRKQEKLKVSPWKGALRDLASPIFLFSIALSFIFAWFNETPQSSLIWAVLRPLSIAFVFFYFMRAVPPQKLQGFVNRFSPTLAVRIGQAKSELHPATEKRTVPGDSIPSDDNGRQ